MPAAFACSAEWSNVAAGRSMAPALPYGDAGRTLAAAIEGGEAELREVLRRGDLRGMVEASRLAPALALRAAVIGLVGREVEAWHRELMAATSHGLLVRRSFEGVAAALGGQGIPWAPIKGLGLSPHVYRAWEERPTGDIDVLVAADDLDRARAALRAAGWAGQAGGCPEADESFLRSEGYNWKAVDAAGVLLELHFRLWGCAPERLGGFVLTRAAADPEAGAPARRLRLADAWALAAVHWWTIPPPRPLLFLWDLRRIAAAAAGGESRFVADVLLLVERWGLHLFAAPVAASAAALWDDAANRAIAAGAAAGLRRAERGALRHIERAGVERAGLESISLARLLAGRASRMGWMAVWRRVWPHPAVLRQKTPAEWSWARRRAWFAARRLRLIQG
jgi:hypothetical protein